MKMRKIIYVVLMMMMVGCTPPGPLSEGEGTPPPVGHPLSEGEGLLRPAATLNPPDPLSKGEGPAHEALEGIDSLMWWRADSALKVMMEFAGSEAADGMDAFEGHYCQVLVAELLFKNDYKQSNRTEVLKAVHYFDSIVDGADGRNADARGKADARGASVQGRNAFLAARAHYINGVGFYERDSVVAACGEYLKALEMVETHFPGIETCHGTSLQPNHLPRFMALTYGRLGDLFSGQFMQEPAIYCYKQALAYNRIAPTSPYGSSNNLYRIGKQYSKLHEADSAAYYFDMALECLSDRNNMIYRDIVAYRALSEFTFHGDAKTALDSLKSMASQAENETERLNRYRTIGGVYFGFEQYDSAKFYLMPVLEKDPNGAMLAAKYLKDIALKEGDTVKANEYALILANKGASAAENQAQVSKLNDIFQNYLQEKQEVASLRERRKAVRMTLMVLVPLLVAIGLAVVLVMRRRHKKRLAAQEAVAQQRLDEASQRYDETERELQTKVEQAAQHTREMLQQHVTDIYQSNSKDRMQRIREAIDNTYPQAVTRLKAEHPELSETEMNILLLNFLHFRIKEEADLLGLSENTVGKYRSNLGKTLGKDPISDWV